MRNTTLMLVHDSGAPPLAPEQLSDHDGEPRIRDIMLAERLGFADRHMIRRLIERNRAELSSYGEIRDAVSHTSEAGGRPGKEYWLNEGQALVLCALSRTPQAAAVRKQVIEVFLAYKRGHLVLEAEQQQTVAQLASEVAELRQRVALIGAAPHVRAAYVGRYMPGTVALTTRDLSLEWGDEPRVFDARVSVQLGLPNQDAVRHLVRTHRGLMGSLGRLVTIEDAAGRRDHKNRVLSAYWLTELQALAVCGLVSGNIAAATRTRIITVFAEFRRAQEALANGGGLIAVQDQARKVEDMAERLAALEQGARLAARKTVRRQRAVEAGEKLSDEGDFLYGVPTIAAYLSITTRQVNHLIETAKLPYLRVGGRLASRKSLLGAWLDAREVRS